MSINATPPQMKQFLVCFFPFIKWLAGVQFLEFMVFNVKSEFLSLFVHRFKTAECQDTILVANLELRQQPWGSIMENFPEPIGHKGDKRT